MYTINIALAILGLASWSLLAITLRKKWLWAIGPITIFLHNIIFYVVLLSIEKPIDPQVRAFFTDWSSGMRLHTLITLTSMGIGLAWERVYRWIKLRSLLR